jgi:hypothetical protein
MISGFVPSSSGRRACPHGPPPPSPARHGPPLSDEISPLSRLVASGSRSWPSVPASHPHLPPSPAPPAAPSPLPGHYLSSIPARDFRFTVLSPGSRAVSSRRPSPPLVRRCPPAHTKYSLIPGWGFPAPRQCPGSTGLCPALPRTSLHSTARHGTARHGTVSLAPTHPSLNSRFRSPSSDKAPPQFRLHNFGFQGEWWSESQRPQTEEAGGYVDVGRG